MLKIPTIDLLEERHDFPGEYIFKVIGSGEDGFVGKVIVAVRQALDCDADPPFRLRQTPSGRHVAITIKPHVTDAAQVMAIYRMLAEVGGVIMVM